MILCDACGRSDEGETTSGLPAEELYNRIEPAREVAAGPATVSPRLGDLSLENIPVHLRTAPCRLTRGNSLLLLSDRSGAAARVDGRVTALNIDGPIGTSGGYFTGPGITISVGATTSQASSPAGHSGARVSIGGARDRPVEKLKARWICPLAE